MARRAVQVTQDAAGAYVIDPDAADESWTQVRGSATVITAAEELGREYLPYRWAVTVDDLRYFVTGAPEPREKSS